MTLETVRRWETTARFFQLLSLERSWTQPLAGEIACCP